MDAIEVLNRKSVDTDGNTIQIVVWEVPKAIPGSRHLFKYRCYFGRHGERIIGYDNERGKGDHKHIGKREFAYDFRDVPTLVADFSKDVSEWRSRQKER
ncbi:MAG: hypothetical protein EOP19_02385 [Hyphomicrobiales bacterium]|nr:MAG: hypothetical protein EOP19_02385 [Hyphomicrobiales bacterium]